MKYILLFFASFMLSALVGILVGTYLKNINIGVLTFSVVGTLTLYIKTVIDYAKRN